MQKNRDSTCNRVSMAELRDRKDDPCIQALRAGWLDGRAHLPPNPQWADHPIQAIASSYENGRLSAANVYAAGLYVPDWPPNSVGRLALIAFRLSRKLIGDPVPEDHRHS